MALLRPSALVRRAADGAVHVAAAGAGLAAGSAVLTAGLVVESTRAGARAARAAAATTVAAAAKSAELAKDVGVGSVRIAGTLVPGSDRVADGSMGRLAGVARGMFEPPQARHSRRVWAAGGRTHVELAAPTLEGGPEVEQALRRHLERLEGVEWAAVNNVVGRVRVAFDDKRISVEDLVGVVTRIERARGGRQVFPQRDEHPADLEPLLAAVVTAAVDTAATGMAYGGKALAVPALTRHATLVLALLDSQQWIRQGLTDRIGPIGTDLVFTGMSALLHALTQSPVIPALNAAAAVQRAAEMDARREVWRRREPELCRPAPQDASPEPMPAPGERPVPLRPGPIEHYRSRLGPTSLAGAGALLALTRQPARSADLLKCLTPKAAVQGREAFATVLDLLMCRRGVLPMDGSAYRRLDRVDVVVLDSDALCTGPPVVLRVATEAEGRDEAALWPAATRLVGECGAEDEGCCGGTDGLRLGPAEESPDAPGGRTHGLFDGAERVGSVVVAAELDPHAEALLVAVGEAGHHLVLTDHVGTREIAGVADEVAAAGEPLLDTVRRLQAGGAGVLAVSAADGRALMAADVAVAPVRVGSAPAWGADLVTGRGLVDAFRIVAATAPARAVSRQSVSTALTGNVLGSLLAAVGDPRRGQRKATTPGKTATALTMAVGTWTALRTGARPPPAPAVHTQWR
jgi:cation-transporting ATPase I